MSSAAIRRRVDDVLTDFLHAEREAADPEAAPLIDELQSIINAGGKRLRPRFCYWGFRAGGGADGAEIIRAGAALELLHTFALIYDDVMDSSPIRRKRTSSHRGLGEGPVGTSAALLTGLLGFVLADRLLWTSGFRAERLAAMTERFDRMRTRAIAGQYLDVLEAHRRGGSEETARRIGALKSGGYSVADPLAIGALGAGASRRLIESLEAFAQPLGEAFQIADDILGVFGDPETTGKDRDGDLREGKQTVLLARTRALAPREELDEIERYVGAKDLDAAEAERVREVMTRCGALDETRGLVTSLTGQAITALESADIDPQVMTALRDLAVEATVRDT